MEDNVMKLKQILFVLILSVITLNLTARAESIKGGILHGIKDELPCPRILLNHIDEFGLNDEQVSKIKELKYKYKKDKAKTHAEIKVLEIELHELLDMKSVDKGEVEEKIEDIGKLYIKKAKDCVGNRLTVRKLLTEEQLQKWESFKIRDCGHGYGYHHGWHEKHEGYEKRGKGKRAGSGTK
jgi:Spy/CpxP family protein refolding chaperone